MQGRQVAITGPTAGIGRAAALELARRGAVLTLLCRSRDKGMALCEEIVAAGGEPPALILVDMADLDSVRRAARDYIAGGRPLDVLLNNAGVISVNRRLTVDGFEQTLAVNHFAPFLLTGMLLPALRLARAARIVTVASDAHSFVRDMGFDDIQAERRYRTFEVYGRSKLANILFTRSLSRRLEGSGITANCLHPGAVATSLGKNNGVAGKVITGMLKPFFRTPERGAATSIYLCSSEEVSAVSGGYFVDCQQRQPRPWALDDAAGECLWRYTQDCTGFEFRV